MMQMVDKHKLLYEHEPAQRWDSVTFEEYLRWLKTHSASDIFIGSGQPVWARIHGNAYRTSRRRIATPEVEELLYHFTGNSRAATEKVRNGGDWDFSYEMTDNPKDEYSKRSRFRGNVTGIRDGWARGLDITLRMNPDLPPTVAALGIEQEIIEAATPINGLILLAGTMGSGKTTTIAALIHYINTHFPWIIRCYENPIEYILSEFEDALGPVTQTEVPFHFIGRKRDKFDDYAGFRDAPRNSARRASDAILVGEARDPETFRSMAESAEIGTRVYSTLHTNSVSRIPGRVINAFPSEEQNNIRTMFLSVWRLGVYQRLVPMPQVDEKTRAPVGRVALREFLNIDTTMQAAILATPVEKLQQQLNKYVKAHGRPLIVDAEEKHKEGRIGDDILRVVQTEYRDTYESVSVVVPDIDAVQPPVEGEPSSRFLRFFSFATRELIRMMVTLILRQRRLEQNMGTAQEDLMPLPNEDELMNADTSQAALVRHMNELSARMDASESAQMSWLDRGGAN